jgi:hypothetical protein
MDDPSIHHQLDRLDGSNAPDLITGNWTTETKGTSEEISHGPYTSTVRSFNTDIGNGQFPTSPLTWFNHCPLPHAASMGSIRSTRFPPVVGDITSIEPQVGMGSDRESSLARGIRSLDATMDIE